MAKIAITTTRYTVLKVSPAVFTEIELRLRLSRDERPFHLMDTGEGRVIDMSGLCIAPDPEISPLDEPIVDLAALIEQQGPKPSDATLMREHSDWQDEVRDEMERLGTFKTAVEANFAGPTESQTSREPIKPEREDE